MDAIRAASAVMIADFDAVTVIRMAPLAVAMPAQGILWHNRDVLKN